MPLAVDLNTSIRGLPIHGLCSIILGSTDPRRELNYPYHSSAPLGLLCYLGNVRWVPHCGQIVSPTLTHKYYKKKQRQQLTSQRGSPEPRPFSWAAGLLGQTGLLDQTGLGLAIIIIIIITTTTTTTITTIVKPTLMTYTRARACTAAKAQCSVSLEVFLAGEVLCIG